MKTKSGIPFELWKLRTRPLIRCRRGIALLFALLVPSACFGATVTWDGGGDGSSWSDAANWSGDKLPGPTDDIAIPAAPGRETRFESLELVVRSVNNLAPLTFAVGKLTVTREFTVSARFNFDGGSIEGNANLASAALNIGADSIGSASFILSGNCPVTGNVAPLQSIWVRGSASGHATLTVPATLAVTNFGTIRLESIDSNWNSSLALGEEATLVNLGSIQVNQGSGGSRILNGNLRNRGSINVGLGARLSLNGVFDQDAGTVVTSGSGVFAVDSGAFNFSGGNTAGQVMITGGQLAVGSGVTQASLVIVQAGGANLIRSDSPAVTIWVRGSANGGHATLTVPATLAVTNSGAIRLESIDSNWNSSLALGEEASLVNLGAIQVNQGSGGSRILNGNLRNRGSINVGLGTRFSLNGPFDQDAGTVVTSGSGAFAVDSGAFNFSGGNTAGQVMITGGQLAVGSGVTQASLVIVQAGGANLIRSDSPAVTIWVRGSANGSHATLTVPATLAVTNSGAIRLESIDSNWSSSLAVGEEGSLFNLGSIQVNQGSGGSRILNGNLRNRGSINVGLGTRLSLNGVFDQDAGTVVTSGSGVFAVDSGAFNFSGGNTAGQVMITGGQLAVGSGVTQASLVIVQEGGAYLIRSDSPAVTIWVRGSASGGHATLTVPATMAVTNSGTIRLESIGVAYNCNLIVGELASLINAGGILVNPGSGGGRVLQGEIFNLGSMFFNTDAVFGSPGARHQNAGLMGLSLANVRLVGASFKNLSTGRITASGTLDCSAISFSNAGVVSPAASPRGLNFLGDYVQTSTGQLEIDIGGSIADVEFDQLDVKGSAQLDGILKVRLVNAFVPSIGDIFPVLTYQQHTGQFSTVSGLEINGTLSLQPAYSPSHLELQTVAASNNGPARIVAQPQSQVIAVGARIELSVVASGTPPFQYQWRKNGVNLDGATNPTFTIPSVQLSDGGSYTVVVSNDAGSVESAPALLSIVLSLLELTDNFADRRIFTEPNFTGTTNNLAATVEPGEPRHAGKRGGQSLWMTWKAPASGVVTFSTVGSSFDTLLAVYTGGAVNALIEVVSDEDRGGFLASKLEFNAVAGTEYQIAVDGFAGASGVVVLSWDLAVTAPALPEITQQPKSRLAVVGDAVQFTVAAQPAGVTYQWLLNGQAVVGQTASGLSLTADASRVGTYRARVTAPNGQTVDSADAILEVLDQPQPNLRLSADKLDDLFDPSEIALANLSRISLSANLPVSQGWVQEADMSQSTRSPEDPEPCGVITSATRWFRIRPIVPASGRAQVLLSTEGSDVPTVLGVFTNRFALTLVACKSKSATVSFAAVQGVDYLAMVGRLGEGAGKVRLSYRGAEEWRDLLTPIRVSGGGVEVNLFVVPGNYVWSWGDDVTAWTPMFQTNVTSGLFQYSEPVQFTAPARLFRLLPAK